MNILDVPAQGRIDKVKHRSHAEVIVAVRGRPSTSRLEAIIPRASMRTMRRNDHRVRQIARFTGVTGDNSDTGFNGDTGDFVHCEERLNAG